MNKEIQNAGFTKKLEYYEGLQGRAPTSFFLTRDLLIKLKPKEWTPREVRKRHKQIITEISKILKIPQIYIRSN